MTIHPSSDQLSVSASNTRGAIAIISVSGRYPGGANSPALLWDLLTEGRDGITEADWSRWDQSWHHEEKGRKGRVYTRSGGFLDDIRGFDAEFFGVSPREAAQIDPQQRLLLELTWELLENAGVTPAQMSGQPVGVYIGISNHDYAQLVGGGSPNAYSNTGSAFSIAANRISYIFNLAGPSMAVDTACSSSLVGVHQACQAILAGECDAAIAGGVNILADIRPWQGFAAASMLSPEGRCKSFDASGSGYVRSEGGGLILLKPLEAAERDGDRILGVIRATGVNSDGRTMGLSMPSVEAQAGLLERLYSSAEISAEDLFYVEAHGTGTSVGDPIECEAIGRVLGSPRSDGSVCHIGSVKSNIGHLEPASGVAGITKILLSFQNRQIPANLHFSDPNPAIDFDNWNLHVVDRPVPLPDNGKPVFVGINSFGFGGTNSHAILQDYQPAQRIEQSLHKPELLMLSAQSETALQALARSYVELLRAPGADWAQIASGTAHFRAPLSRRLVVRAAAADQAADRLAAWLAQEKCVHVAQGSAAQATVPVAFVYSGNGPQWWGMGRELLAESTSFKASIAAVDKIFAPLAGWSLLDEMARPESESRIELTEVAQPMLFAIQVGVTEVLRSSGVTPSVVFGHSVGEVAAAWASGALGLDAATRVIFHRSREQAKTAGTGKMAALGIDADTAAKLIAEIGGWLEIAARNAPEGITVAGDETQLTRLVDRVIADGKFARLLTLDYPFHTKAMDVCRAGLSCALSDLSTEPAQTPFISTVTGATLEGTALNAEYWFRNVREPVLFEDAVYCALKDHDTGLILEIGPHPVLRDYILQLARTHSLQATALATLRRPGRSGPESDVENISQALASAVAHAACAPAELCDRPAIMPDLPNYPWQRSEHWRGAVAVPDFIAPVQRDHPLLGGRLSSAGGYWEGALNISALSYLCDHCVQNTTVFPGAGYVEQALAAGRLVFGDDGAINLEALSIHRPLTLDTETDLQTQVQLDPNDGRIEIRSCAVGAAADTTLHFTGRVSHIAKADPQTHDLATIKARLPVEVAPDAFYTDAQSRGLSYGPAFQGIQRLCLSAPDAPLREALAEVRLDLKPYGGTKGYISHPALFDSGLQGAVGLIAQGDPRKISTLPISIESLRVFQPLGEHFFCHIVLKRESLRSVLLDIFFLDTDGMVLLEMRGARCQKANLVEQGPAPLITDAWRYDDSQPVAAELPAIPSVADLFGDQLSAQGAAVEQDRFAAMAHHLMGLYAAEALAALRPPRDSFDLAALTRHARIRRNQSDYLKHIVSLAESSGAITATDHGWQWQGIPAEHEAQAVWAEMFQSFPDRQPEMLLLAEAGDAVLRRLTEKEEIPLSATALEQLFDTAQYASGRNQMLAQAFSRLVACWPTYRPMRVLEVGAWAGGLTATLLPLMPERCSWTATDPADDAVARLTRRFEQEPMVKTRSLSATEGFEAQGLGRGTFDIVLLSRPDRLGKEPGFVLGEIRRVLADGGIVLIAGSADVAFETFILGQAAALSPQHLTDAGLTGAGVLSSSGMRAGVITACARKTVPLDAGAVVAQQGYIVVGDPQDSLATEVVACLTAAGHTVTQLDLDAPGRVQDALVAQLANRVILVSPDGGADCGPAGQDRLCHAALDMVRALEEATAQRPECDAGLTIVTRAAFPSGFGDAPANPAAGALWGFGRVIANEHPACGLRLIDLHPAKDAGASARWLAREIQLEDDETEVQTVQGQRFVNRAYVTSPQRLARAAQQQTDAFVLDFLPQGGFESLHLRELTRRHPGPQDVEIAVKAAGLNFRDVLWCMGMLPEEAVEHGFSGATIGMECAGEILRVGEDVTDFSVGDRVVAFASSCLGSHVTTSAGSVAKMPEGMDFAAAATIPTTFLTAWYAFDYLARLEPGETVLIHGAAGGVGLAAIQIAKMKGAIVIGTAGSPLKRRVLELLGVDHVLNSRTLDFADDVMRLTDGKGVDVILNSLAGEAILRNLNCLKPFGRFLEIGKRDFYANSRVGLRPFRNNLSYFGIDADTLLVERPDLGKRMFAQVLEQFRAGNLRPLPHQSIPVARAAEAFRLMQQSRHIGKIVVSMQAAFAGAPVVVPDLQTIRSDGTYLVTGGLAGFGLETARWLAANGARSLALVSRSGADAAGAQETLAAFNAAGVTACAFAADIADADAVAGVLHRIRATMPPLVGVVHAAAVIEDAPLVNVTPEQMQRVFRPKMTGAWNLHQQTLGDPVETFIMYSSASAFVGNPGQSVYVAANLYLETLAMYRKSLGLPALAVGWGAILDAGFLTRHENVVNLLRNRSGMDAMPVQQALSDLGRVVATGAERVGIARFDMIKLHQMIASARAPRFAGMIPSDMMETLSQDENLTDIVKALPRSERMPFVLERLRENIARILGTTATQISTDQPISDLGLDSLMAVELGTAIERDIGSNVPVMQLLSAGSLMQVAAMIGSLIGLDEVET
ncbi:MAG: SDR family NAD(P)-dependent oxidoreductase [Rhodobacteraceae bacterium]|nr:SDR family NAD(P)-dependent oxidoreductase [Paracoccaceae bacterium]